MIRFPKWMSRIVSTAIRCFRKNERCPRERLLSVLSTQVLEFTGQIWLAAGLQLVKTEQNVVVFFLGSDGSFTDPSIVISQQDPLHHKLSMKMRFAVRRQQATTS